MVPTSALYLTENAFETPQKTKQSAVDQTTGSTYYYNEEGLTQWEPPV